MSQFDFVFDPICHNTCHTLQQELLCARALGNGQSCCTDQHIRQWEINTGHYLLVLQNICQGVQGLQGIQSPVCKGRQKNPQESLVMVCGSALKSTAGKAEAKLPLIYVSLRKLPLLLDLQLRNGFSEAARSACLPPPPPQPAWSGGEVISQTRCAAGACCSVN